MSLTLKVRLVGEMFLTDGSGRNLTPRGAKARGLVALLALSPERRRPRRWIEGKLWSDRGPDQASGSLRQALVELRSALGSAAATVVADREAIGFSGLVTDVDMDPDGVRAALRAGRDLLEGLDLRDPAFERWLAEQRARVAGRPGATTHLSAEPEEAALPLLIRTGTLPEGFGGFVALALAEAIGKLVSEFSTIDVYGPNKAAVYLGTMNRGLVLGIEASQNEGRLHLIATLGSLRTGQMFWSRHAQLPLCQSDIIAGDFPGLVFEAAEAVQAALPRVVGTEATSVQVDGIVARAVREMFTFDAHRLRLADALLTEAAALAPTPRVYAWHSLLKQIMAIERTEPGRDALLTEAMIYTRKAMEGAPSNPLVLALVSQVQVMLAGDAEGGAALARTALSMSPNNAFAHAAQAGSLLRQGRAKDAYQSARTGARLAARSSFLHWWEALSGLSALSMGNYPVAIAHHEAARSRAPHFRAPLRNLLFLYLESGQPEKAAVVLRDLQRIEPDFSLHRIREDPEYPASTLRTTQLLTLQFPEQAM